MPDDDSGESSYESTQDAVDGYIENSSMLYHDNKATVFNARYDNDFFVDYLDEF